jgi:hypothetical protein
VKPRLRTNGSIWLLLLAVATVSGGPLPDTGQTVRHTRTFGEDSDFAGAGPRLRDNGDGTVTDEITGLMWQRSDGGEMTLEAARVSRRGQDETCNRAQDGVATLQVSS